MTLFDDDADAHAGTTRTTRVTTAATPTEVRTRVRMTVAYDGSGFKGFAVQPGVKTVAGALQEAAARVLGHDVKVTCAGRTDAGVHAWGQVIHFDSPLDGDELDLVALQRSLNRMLKPAIVVRDAGPAAEGFDARHSAVARRYRYTVVNRPVADPFLANTAWHVEHPLDLRTMLTACDPFLGEHDFTSFCKRPDDPQRTMTRRVHDAVWHDLGDGVLRFDIEAQSFCHQMVRSIVGTLVDVGLGKMRAGDIAWVLRSKDRAAAGPVAPPHGLCLWEVLYA
ncbi:MAG TPA: tRNA pseudouridine(38-40) synthase TruA [Acidimicrobiales bacterium]